MVKKAKKKHCKPVVGISIITTDTNNNYSTQIPILEAINSLFLKLTLEVKRKKKSIPAVGLELSTMGTVGLRFTR